MTVVQVPNWLTPGSGKFPIKRAYHETRRASTSSIIYAAYNCNK